MWPPRKLCSAYRIGEGCRDVLRLPYVYPSSELLALREALCSSMSPTCYLSYMFLQACFLCLVWRRFRVSQYSGVVYSFFHLLRILLIRDIFRRPSGLSRFPSILRIEDAYLLRTFRFHFRLNSLFINPIRRFVAIHFQHQGRLISLIFLCNASSFSSPFSSLGFRYLRLPIS